jgi:NAD(P)-dependent dehydrogenase (short-subunit alcohol dehydrogenase family)
MMAESSGKLVPQLEEFGITEQDLAVAIKVLEAVSSLDPKNVKKNKKRKATSDDGTPQPDEIDGLSEFRKSNLRQFRKSLASCLSLHQQLMYDGKSEKEFYEQRLADRTLKRQKMAERAQQKKYVAATDLRRGRVEKLEKLKEDAKDEEEAKLLQFLIPDGHVETSNRNGVKLLVKDASDNDDDDEGEQDDGKVLPKLRSCYVCKVRFRILHHFYDQLCPDCALFNYNKRNQTADLTGTVAVVTGSRVKIGFQVCLKLLRAGATVVATTRFPNNAVAAYRRESDFNQWSDRLHVYGLDLRDVTGLEAFTRYLKVTYKNGIDILINNACQTVRRPAGYYLPLVERESDLWSQGDESHRNVLAGCQQFERIRRRLVVEQGHAENKILPTGSNGNLLLNSHSDRKQVKQIVDATTGELVKKGTPSDSSTEIPFDCTGISHSAAMSQMAIIPEDVGIDEKVMPSGLSDINGHQVDLRTTNSWLLKIDEVSTPEIMECMFVNAIAPFVLNSRLTPLMEAPVDDPERPDRFIINVSAMEGKFYRYKMPNHPHTNMAKAALNMLTRTSSEELAKKSRIFMNSVDTGWINDENPLEKASKIAQANLFMTPIDEIDAAARILDPIISAKNDKSTVQYGCFFKDYKETEW